MIVFVDVETTGLLPRSGSLIEIALVVTDDRLNEVDAIEMVVRPVGASVEEMVAEQMDDFVKKMHTDNGLIEALQAETGTWRRHVAEDALVDFCKMHESAYMFAVEATLKGVPLAGSTVSFDRAWMKEHMPKLEALFSYRSVDVSSFTEMAKRWAPAIYDRRPKAGKAHRALADARESIAYLRFYSDNHFIVPDPARAP